MITIRGKEYAIAHVTDVIIKELSSHSDETKSREYRHRNTFNLLKVVLDPPLPDELFLPDIGLLLLNDVEIVGIISAAAEALSQDENFTGSLSGLEALTKDNPEAQGAIAQLRTVLGKPAEVGAGSAIAQMAVFDSEKTNLAEATPGMRNDVEFPGITAEEVAMILAVRSASTKK